MKNLKLTKEQIKAEKKIKELQDKLLRGEFIDQVFKTTVGELNNLDGWDFPLGEGCYEEDMEITIMITSENGELEAWWGDDFDYEKCSSFEDCIYDIVKLGLC